MARKPEGKGPGLPGQVGSFSEIPLCQGRLIQGCGRPRQGCGARGNLKAWASGRWPVVRKMRGWEESRGQRSGDRTEPSGEEKATILPFSISLSVSPLL